MKAPLDNRLHRMFLHIACMMRDHRWTWHWRGIFRELHF